MHVEKYQAAAMGGVLQHYERRAELERGYRRENIDPARTALNYNLGPAREGVTQAQFVDARIDSLALKRAPRKDAVRFCDCVLTLPQTFPKDRSREFFEEAYAFLSGRYGADNVVSAWVHMDETTPHMHFCWVPVTGDGRLSAKDVLCRADLRTLHQDLRGWLEPRLGVPCDVLLDDSERAKKELSRLPQEDYKAALREVEETERRLEGLRREEESLAREVEELQPIAEHVSESLQGLKNNRNARRREETLRNEIEGLRGQISDAECRVREQGERLGRLDALVGKARRLLTELVKAGLRDVSERARAALGWPMWFASPSHAQAEAESVETLSASAAAGRRLGRGM